MPVGGIRAMPVRISNGARKRRSACAAFGGSDGMAGEQQFGQWSRFEIGPMESALVYGRHQCGPVPDRSGIVCKMAT